MASWFFDFFANVLSTSIEHNSVNIGRTTLQFCHRMENCRSSLSSFRALFTKRIRSYDRFRVLRENLIIWEGPSYWVICGQIMAENS